VVLEDGINQIRMREVETLMLLCCEEGFPTARGSQAGARTGSTSSGREQKPGEEQVSSQQSMLMLEAQRCYYLHQYQSTVDLISSTDFTDVDFEIDSKVLESKANYCLCKRGISHSTLYRIISQYAYDKRTSNVCALLARLFPWHPGSKDLAELSIRLTPEASESHAAYITALSYNHLAEQARNHFEQFNRFLHSYDNDYCEIIINSRLGNYSYSVRKSIELMKLFVEPIDFSRILYCLTVGMCHQFHGNEDKAVQEAMALIEEIKPISEIDRARAYLVFARVYLYAGNVSRATELLDLATQSGLEQHPYLWWALGWLCARGRRDIQTATAALESFLSLSDQYRGIYDIQEEGWYDLCRTYSFGILSLINLMKINFYAFFKYVILYISNMKLLDKYEESIQAYIRQKGCLDFDIP